MASFNPHSIVVFFFLNFAITEEETCYKWIHNKFKITQLVNGRYRT